jgi:vacuolar protein-sorting-associated protein 4
MEPIRTCTLSQHFKKVKGKDPKTGEIVDDLLTPCLGTDDNAIEMTLNDIPGNKLLAPRVTYKDFEKAIKNSKPSVSKDDLKQYEKYTEEFGEEG